MRNANSLLRFLLPLFVAPCFAQRASVNVSADAGLPRDTRSFGKYLVEICTLSGEERTLDCVPTVHKPGAERLTAATPPLTAQAITLKLACDPATKGDCNSQFPLVAGTDFFVAATADSGQMVRQRVLSGSATPVGGSGTVRYRPGAAGFIIIRATADATARFAAAAPVDLILQVVADQPKAGSGCLVLPPPASPAQTTLLDAPTIVSLLGNPTPFILAAQGPNTIAIYSTRQPLQAGESRILASFQDSIRTLALRTGASLGITPPAGKPFTVELAIPHASALGDLATKLGGLNYSQFTLQDVGSDKIRVNAATQPDCDTWQGFLSDIRRMDWQLISEPMSTKLFYLSSADVATAFSTGLVSAPPAAAAPAATPSTTSGGGSNAVAASSNAGITVTQPPGSNIQINSDTTPCVVAGLASGNSSACGPAAPATAPATTPAPSVIPAPKAPLAMGSVAVAAGNGEQNPPDLLVFSDANPGDDAQILERNRIIAQLDLPRPEMIINAWVTQNSSASPTAMGAFTNMVKGLVADYDDEFQNVVLRGWASLKAQSAAPGYFNEPFRSYIADRFIADTYHPGAGKSPQEMSQAFLDNSQAVLADPVFPQKRTDLGICERGRYCLGYNNLFNPVKPALTDLLLTIVAAQNPVAVVDNAISAVENLVPGSPLPIPSTMAACDAATINPDARSRCRAIWSTLDLDHASPQPGPRTCADQDYRGILASLLGPAENRPRVHLQCFKKEADLLLGVAANEEPPYGAGLLRAAIADFLFNYKMSQHYPHEFVPYDLSHSADALNNALNPLLDAFNRDLAAYQIFVRADMQYRVELLNARNDGRSSIKRIFGVDKPSFFNDGLVTVRTISGQWTYVNTTSQSFLNTSTAPELSTLLNSLGGSNPNSTAVGSPLSTVLSATPLNKTAALAAALANYQTTFAQVGRTLQFSAIPRSLNTASSAEIAVTLNADESAGGPMYAGGGATDPAQNTSRVASHDTATRVRVDSVKLFEVSSFTSIVERSRSRFPLLPPFVEIPYIGTFAGIPLAAAKEYHSSTAIISAYVMPTAADLAYGIRFVSDLVVDGLNPGPCSFFKGAAGPGVTEACLFRKALSLLDLNKQPVSNFNKEMVRCLATDISPGGCKKITFDRAPKTY
jgi:hypothetical protein